MRWRKRESRETRRQGLARRMFLFNRRHTLDYEAINPYESTGSSRTMDQIARALWYSATWDTRQAHKRWIVEHMIYCEGVTEADIRDMRYLFDRDVAIVRLWNWRKFQVDGIHMTQHERGRT